ncbi:MAG: hypothetical protein MMC33_004492 [Icmadophila ericetorum]|nr:hypothetical protein [Icmadophila ericetorum]
MSVAERRRQDVESSLNSLSLHPSSSSKSKKKASFPRQPVADSWEDQADDLSSGSDTESESTHPYSKDMPSAPPPTPSSPFMTKGRRGWGEFENPYSPFSPSESASSSSPASLLSPGSPGFGASGRAGAEIRPEKTTAVAGRLIAGALGVRVPKKTEEMKEYEKAIREKEARRREKEREGKRKEEDAARKAREDIWES